MVTPELRQELEIRNALQKDLGKLLEARCEEELSVFQGRRPPSPEVCVQAVLEKWFQTGNALSNGNQALPDLHNVVRLNRKLRHAIRAVEANYSKGPDSILTQNLCCIDVSGVNFNGLFSFDFFALLCIVAMRLLIRFVGEKEKKK